MHLYDFCTTSSTLIRPLPCTWLHFCKTSSTLIRPLVMHELHFCTTTSTLMEDHFHAVWKIFARHLPHSLDNFHAPLHVLHDIFHTHQTDKNVLMHLLHGLHDIFHMSCRPLKGAWHFYIFAKMLRCDIFHTHQTTFMHLYIFAPHLPHSSDHFHAPLYFCTTSSTIIRLLPCTLTFLHDIFHTHQTTSMHLYIFAVTSSTLIRPLSCSITFLHDIFHTHQTTSSVDFYIFARHLPHSSDHFHAPLHFCTTSSTLIRPLPCTFTFLHRHLPHSSDHFHASLHFCTTSSTLIRPLP